MPLYVICSMFLKCSDFRGPKTCQALPCRRTALPSQNSIKSRNFIFFAVQPTNYPTNSFLKESLSVFRVLIQINLDIAE